ncbi:uncharacterized protein N7503_001241 [Penicillium pulvis]|uniref:uncharacterized protein n=1 Tax=Penicillium pulvis TaxID=1562058 RepID=UPI002546C562|nr:uncharacterized protein N7503_001226 [Penicillium pulvis]XP_056924749.1 uncharacterized protein N7503_001231 [Penicillium pulvis]XP_056924751.1 uncharacterized protein N7503_001236 [Penicillium pulvis]XP_056924753.1 uncharacterized protein N7503_001241 [Penicillium pulvis]KAJ5809008.1 hypothetical protein N7503_001226 [Penicillium pulvis]KAJ5809013.1 hypothetical protein N7503_001231 [Penicillium pulvis]KAJ5809018.1 hypothetical protein N7503_001236 [Penicillium pulvis]KAJ5809023.1 hypoth
MGVVRALGRPSFQRTWSKGHTTRSTEGGLWGRASPRPSSRRPPTAGQQPANWGITTTLPSRRQRSLCGQGQSVVDWRAQPTLASGSKPVTRLPSKRPALPVPLMGRY